MDDTTQSETCQYPVFLSKLIIMNNDIDIKRRFNFMEIYFLGFSKIRINKGIKEHNHF